MDAASAYARKEDRLVHQALIRVRSPIRVPGERTLAAYTRHRYAARWKEDWIVDIGAQLVERWRTGEQRPDMIDDRFEWELSTGTSGTVAVQELVESPPSVAMATR